MTRDDMVQGAWSEDSIGETRADVVTGSARMKQPRTPRVRVNVQDGRVLDERRLRSGLKQLVRAVNVLHHRGLLHLDIKPSNILVGTAGRVVLLDFGLVRPLGPDQSQSNMTLGTPAYMAPEQAAGEPVGRAADWYAVGGVLYRALTGELPFVGGAADVMLAKQLDEPLHPRELVKDIPEDLANLAVELLRLDPSKRPSGREVWARIGGDLRVDFLESGATRHFVGRAREIEALRHAVGDAARGKRVVVRLSGASAIGKTTLIRHVLGACRDDIYLLEGETFERESVPFVSFDRPIDCLALVMQQLGQAGLPPEITRDLRVLSRMFPVLGTLVSDGAQDVAGIGDARRRGSRAFCNIVAWLSSQGKLPVVWIDSAQWSDRDSALLMRAMLSSDIIDRILVILSYRRGEGSSSPLLSDLERLERAQLAITWRQMDLSPLTDEAVRELARASLSEDARDEVVDAIALESAGNPLFVEAMCRYGRHLQDRTSSATRLSLHHVVAEIFEALSPTARRLLETLAVFGRPMSVDMLFPAADLADEDRVESVEALVDEQIVSTHQGERALMLSIAHDKIRELIVAWIEPEVLVALHRSIAVALTREEDYDPEHIMHHFAEGGVLDIVDRPDAGPF
ncbi:MAG: protein kinase domain-containing protein, partial [Nannocystaceae bacterium]